MGQLLWRGRDRARFLETVCVADVQALKEGSAALTVVTTASGGVLDDSILSNSGNGVHYMVVNGATKAGDMAHFDAQLAAFRAANAGADVAYEYLPTQNLVALQGPAASAVLARLVDGGAAAGEAVAELPFMSGRLRVSVAGVPCSVTRCGYTGEDGYEVGMAAEHAETVARALLADARVLPAGLGCRDSLRLEAGLCLYGHDMDTSITPNEASLMWVIPKSRRDLASPRANFLGAKAILGQLAAKSWAKRRVGLSVQGAPAREGARIFARGGAEPVGTVTSGTFSPVLKAPIAMGYVQTALMADGTALDVEVRGKRVPAVVTKMPFVPTRYYRG
jgi:aminomethyltransferase